MAHRWNEWFTGAERHHAVLLVANAVALDIPREAVRRRAQRDDLRALTREAWLAPGVRPSLEARAVAAVRTAGTGAVASHLTAAWLHGLLPRPRRIELTRPMVHVTIPHDRRIRAIAHTQVHRSRWLAEDCDVIDGIEVTSSARTLRDLAASLPDVRLRNACIDAEQRRLVTMVDLERQLGRRRSAPGGARFARVVLARRADRTQSALESDTFRFVQEHGWRVTPDHPVRCRDGRILHVDLALVEHRVAIECDGLAYHAGRRPFELDRRRWSALKRAHWEVLWVTRDRLDHRQADLVDELRDATASTAAGAPRDGDTQPWGAERTPEDHDAPRPRRRAG